MGNFIGNESFFIEADIVQPDRFIFPTTKRSRINILLTISG